MTATTRNRAPERTVPFVVLAPFAVGGGLLASLAFAPVGLWVAAFAAVVVLASVVGRSARLRTAVALGLAYGLAFNLVTLSWQAQVQLSSYLGLVVLQSAYFALLGGLLFGVRSLPWTPLASAASWVLVEAVQSRFPFGGFGWTRLGYAMIDTPLAGLYPFAGVASASFAVALVGQSVAWTLASRTRRRALVAGAVTAGVFVAGAAGSLLPGADPARARVNVGWVQGGASGAGFYGIGEPGETGRNHAAETKALLGAVAAGSWPKPDFVVWPENGTDMDPLVEPGTNKLIADAVAAAGVPILVGVPTNGPLVGQRQTTYLWWTNAGVTARYDKRDLVPFGEWIPFRDVLLPLLPILSVIGDQAIPGDRPGALAVTGRDGRPLTVGVAICYEVAFPETVHDAVSSGAEVMIVGSNNAMFQGSGQIEQQFAITRVRAAELRRQILVVTTSGISGLIDDHGRVVMRGAEHVADSGVVSLTRSTNLSPLLLGGWLVEYLIAALGAGAAAWAAVGSRPRGSGRLTVSPRSKDRAHD